MRLPSCGFCCWVERWSLFLFIPPDFDERNLKDYERCRSYWRGRPRLLCSEITIVKSYPSRTSGFAPPHTPCSKESSSHHEALSPIPQISLPQGRDRLGLFQQCRCAIASLCTLWYAIVNLYRTRRAHTHTQIITYIYIYIHIRIYMPTPPETYRFQFLLCFTMIFVGFCLQKQPAFFSFIWRLWMLDHDESWCFMCRYNDIFW